MILGKNNPTPRWLRYVAPLALHSATKKNPNLLLDWDFYF